MPYIKRIAELRRTDLPLAGGKGANLGELHQAGLPVPDGFVIMTEGYRAFVTANHLDADLHPILAATRMDDPAALDVASQKIQACFAAGQIPQNLAAQIRQAYLALSLQARPQSQAVAVRSSATAEDLPDLSFAGQQDTYLNIIGPDALLDAVTRCWASLWTARAMGYRARNAIPHDDVALAVVVQKMVQSQASGVLFTANPLTGKRAETVVDATFGLGEALVSGQVEPDHYVIDTASGQILSKTLGAKALSIQGQPGGGTITVEDDASQRQALPDAQILALSRLGQQAAAHFSTPQDMEWTWAEGQLAVVQSRPITSLYPLPANMAADPLEALLSFGVWQGMLDPYTPLGQEIFNVLVSGMASLFSVKLQPEDQRLLLTAGERLFVNFTGLLRNPRGRGFLSVFVAVIDPVSGEIVADLLTDPRFAPTGGISLRTGLRLIRGLFPFAKSIVYNLLFPRRGRLRLQNLIDTTNAQVRAQCAATQTLDDLVAVIADQSIGMVKIWMPTLVAGVASGQAPLQILLRLSATAPRGPELVMELTRGLPHNVTTEMDLALWETAQAIRADSSAADHFAGTEPAGLVEDYRAGILPPIAQAAIAHFLNRYGVRGVGEIDLGRPRWREEPTSVFQAVKSYLQIDETKAPDRVFRRGAERAEQAKNELAAVLSTTPGGWIKSRLAKGLATRLRELGGLRESPKFAIIQRFGIFREALLRAGQSLVEDGVLAAADDLFYLAFSELNSLGRGDLQDWAGLIAARRATYQREQRRKRIPRIMLSDGRAFYDAPTAQMDENAATLSGTPVSAGTVEGRVHVVLDPHGAQLAPGEILVCPATDPAWTPLFLAAGGLVMEVGGMMTHGSVVAREYGIPAIVGVRNATERLVTGQRVRVDGASGTITILQD